LGRTSFLIVVAPKGFEQCTDHRNACSHRQPGHADFKLSKVQYDLSMSFMKGQSEVRLVGDEESDHFSGEENENIYNVNR
jgi:hypothetical protein